MVSKRRLVYAVPAVLVILSLACSLPGLSPKPSPVSTSPVSTEIVSGVPEPTSTPQPLPPALVETNPVPGSEIPLSQPITLYFNQAMDRSSVQSALSGQPTLAGSFSWDSDTSLTFIPDAPFLPETELTITLSSQARSRGGMALLNPLSISYRTTGYLKLTQALPESGAERVDPTSAVVVAFNRPVVALGADQTAHPAGFEISSASGETPPGRGEWTNTATYIFYPEPGLAGGVEYSVAVNPSLTGVDGAPLEQSGEETPPISWSFTTAVPRLISVVPEAGSVYNPLDRQIVLTFSQTMDSGSFDSAFRLQDAFGQNVPGEQTWSEDGSTLTFIPSGLLARGSQYTIILDGSAQAAGGTPLGQDVSQTFFTVADLSIYGSSPEAGGTINPNGFIELYLTSFLPTSTVEEQVDLSEYFSLSPQAPNLNYYFDTTTQTLRIFGSFQPDTDYTLTVSANLTDQWGGRLGTDYVLPFHTGPLDPNLYITTGTDIFFLTPQENTITVQATNLSQIPMSVGSVPLEDFILMAGMNGYDIRNTYQPVDQLSWTAPISVTPNKSEAVQLPLSPDGASLSPGLYYMRMDPLPGKLFATPYLAVVSNLNITFKLSPSDAAVWAVDLRTGEPVANVPVSIIDENGILQAQGETDASGLFHAQAGPFADSYSPRYAVIGEPGQEFFGLAVSTWSFGLEPGNFGLPVDFQTPGLKTYIYTDRPIYRPGQTVYFRVVARDARNGRYAMPQVSSIPLVLYDDMGQVVTSYDLQLSAFGTAHGQYELPTDARPGFYRIGEFPWALDFAVADYRKPEINLSVSFAEDQVMAGQPLHAEINARYFFDAPASNVPVQWSLYVVDTYYDMPGYSVGESSLSFFDMFRGDFVPELGQLVDSGESTIGPDGLLSLALTPPEDDHPGRKLYTLEVTLKDESGLPVSARAQVITNPASYYIGIRPGQWFGRAGTSMSFDIQTVSWDGSSNASKALLGEFNKVTWVRDENNPVDMFGMPNWVKKYQDAGSVDFSTGPDGRAVLSFTADDPGTYELRISGDGTASSVILWVGGEGQAVWPELPNQRLTLTTAQTSYRPGDIAGVFIPNPFGAQVQALVSVERGETLRMEVVEVPAEGLDYQLPLTLDDAPNIYVSVTMLGKTPSGDNDFRLGFVELKVDPSDLELNVQITVQPEKAGPGDDVTLAVRITDSSGEPVQGEFSLAVADLAALMLADPNSADIRAAFYGDQPLSVKTALDLAVSTRRFTFNPGGMGGGGGAGVEAVARENFPDTAYWNPQVVTDANGEAVISLTLPDTLTTWQVDVRGLTASTQVGEASSQLITSKELLVRPVTPRFLVAGDRVLLAAVVQNNTAVDMDTAVALQSSGVVLDDSSPEQHQIVVPAGGRARVEWWVKVEDVESVDLVFSASSGDFQDASRPAGGKLPVIGFSAPQAFATSGTLDGSQDSGGLERLELISLPRTFDPRSGELRLELTPSLGAALIRGLDALEQSPYESTEQILSRFLPNLETYRALNEMGIDLPDLQARLDRTLQDGLSRLVARQNDDGGWGWWQRASGQTGSNSDLYITSYVLYGLARCQQEGISVNQAAIDKGLAYLGTSLPGDYDHLTGDDLDRLAFEVFVLGELSQIDVSLPGALYDRRDQLSPWAQSFVALTIDKLSPGDERVKTIFSDIQGLAIRSGAGVHWEDRSPSARNYSTPVTGSAIVVYALSRLEPASTLIPDAVRYLMANRNPRGGWNSSYETAWVTLSVLEVMKGTGEWTGSYDFDARLNGAPFAGGQAAGSAGDTAPVLAAATIDHLYPDSPNALVIRRGAGDGRLYYSAYLDVMQPVDTVAPLNRGVVVERSFFLSDCTGEGCLPVSSAAAGQSLQVRVTVVLPHDAYNLVLEDYIPAGSEVLDTSLKTSQLGEQLPLNLDPGPSSMGWWYFQGPRIYDDHVTWAADFLPAGTYELTYTLVLLQPGEFRVVPARAWEFYFPDVQGNSAGDVFEITPEVAP